MKDTTIWRELAHKARKVNEDNGFEAPSWENLLGKLMLTVTELDEFVAACEPGKPYNGPEEVADTIIRILDMLQAIWPGEWAMRTYVWSEPRDTFKRPEELAWPVISALCMAAEHWRKNDKENTRIALEIAFNRARILGDRLPRANIEVEVRNKIRVNALRGYLHGKKQKV